MRYVHAHFHCIPSSVAPSPPPYPPPTGPHPCARAYLTRLQIVNIGEEQEANAALSAAWMEAASASEASSTATEALYASRDGPMGEALYVSAPTHTSGASLKKSESLYESRSSYASRGSQSRAPLRLPTPPLLSDVSSGLYICVFCACVYVP